MSDLKSNDIDELFKRASEKYPLRTDSADWDKLAAALDKDPSLILPPPNTEGYGRRRRRFFWLFLLLPLGGVIYWTSSIHKTPAQTSGTGVGPAATVPKTAVPAASGQSNGGPAAVPDQSGSLADRTTRKTPEAGGISASPAQPGSASKGSTHKGTVQGEAIQGVTAGTKLASNIPARATGSVPAGPGHTERPGHTEGAGHTAGPIAAAPGPKVASQRGSAQKTQVRTSSGATATGRQIPSQAGVNPDRQTAYMSGKNGSSEGEMGNREHNPRFSDLNFQRAHTAEGVALNVSVKANNLTTATKDSSAIKSGSKKNNKSKKESFFYAGLLAAPDLSTVKMQSVKEVGTTYGILLGYQFNRKWAVETGLYLDRKKYYSDAEYFNKKNTSIPSYYNLVNLNGTCNMFEIPVNLRYNLSSGEKTKWFATAGLSTYLMSSENYTFEIDANNPWSRTWKYKNHPQNWFSIINLSIGYEQRLGKIGNLRLEPYLRVPLSGVGTGSLPIMSAGLNIGITHKLW